MQERRDEIELQQFYALWAPHVTLFCRLYTGDSEVAETVAAKTFLRYAQSELPLALDGMPSILMALALVESTRSRDGGGADVDSDFEWAVLSLPPDERAVFILHGTLGLPLPSVAAITQLPFSAVDQLWARALLQLRLSTVKDDCSRLFQDRGAVIDILAGVWA